MNLQFQTADMSDVPLIFTEAKNLIDAYEDVSSIDYEKVLAWMNRKITQNISQYCSVWIDGEKCAFYRLCEDGELDDLYVLPGFQNMGIGTEILKKCIAESNNPMYLYVFSHNTRAIVFYERLGFSVSERVGKTRLILRRNG